MDYKRKWLRALALARFRRNTRADVSIEASGKVTLTYDLDRLLGIKNGEVITVTRNVADHGTHFPADDFPTDHIVHFVADMGVVEALVIVRPASAQNKTE